MSLTKVLVDGECSLSIAASGSYMARAESDSLLVSYRHVGGYRRSPGNLAFPSSGSIDWSRMSLWSTLVVSLLVAQLYDRGTDVVDSTAYACERLALVR